MADNDEQAGIFCGRTSAIGGSGQKLSVSERQSPRGTARVPLGVPPSGAERGWILGSRECRPNSAPLALGVVLISSEESTASQQGKRILPTKANARSVEKAKHAKPSYTLDDAPGFLLRVALRTHTAIFTAKMIEGLTGPQFSTLAKLREVGPCSQNHLGRLIHYDSATITGVITRLKARDLITSNEDPLDPRRREVDLTDKGRRIADAAIETVREISRETFSPLSQQEFRTLTGILKKIIHR